MNIKVNGDSAFLYAGIHASSLSALNQLLTKINPGSTSLYADIFEGSYKGFSVAKDFASQLNMSEVSAFLIHPAIHSNHPDMADVVGKLIDAENGGDIITYSAFRLAKDIVSKSARTEPKNFIVLMPESANEWSKEDIKFLEFLNVELDKTAHTLWLVSTEEQPYNLPHNWVIDFVNTYESPIAPSSRQLASFLPGIIPARVIDKINELNIPMESGVWLSDGSFVIDLEDRISSSGLSAALLDELGKLTKTFGWLEGWRHLHMSGDKARHELLFNEAENRFAEGGYLIAINYYKRAMEVAPNPIMKAAICARLQAIRISLMHFEDVAKTPNPSVSLPPNLVGMLCQNKAWGLTMLNRAQEAEPYLQNARELMKDMVSEREYMYLLNISALNKLKLGLVNEALKFEQTIEEELFNLPRDQRDYHLEYINSLNMARLYKRMGDNNEALRLYERGFDTCLGVRSESDLLYRNICFAQIFERTTSHEMAFQYWFRAALHWLAFEVPEGIAPRVAGGAIGKPMAAKNIDINSISENLFTNLYNAIQRIPAYKDIVDNIENNNDSTSSYPVYRYSDKISEPGNKILVGLGNEGWGVFLSQTKIPSINKRNFNYNLYNLVTKIIKKENSHIPFETVIVDAQLGTEMPINRYEFISAAIRLKCDHIYYNSEKIFPELFVDQLGVQLGKAVKNKIKSDKGEIEVQFKRYLSPIKINNSCSELLLSINGNVMINDLTRMFNTLDVYQILRNWEANKVVSIGIY